MRRRGPALLVLALVIVGLLVAADVITRVVVERKVADRVAAEVPSAESTSARIRSFPFLPRLLATDRIDDMEVTVRGAEVRGLEFDTVRVQLHSVEIDRSSLVQDRRVVLENVRRGTVRAEVTEAAISALSPVPVHLGSGRASVMVFGQEVGASLAVRDGRLTIGAAEVTIPALDLVAPLLPCVPDAEVVPGRVVLTCVFEGLPAELRP